MKHLLRSLATVALLFFTGALFIAATNEPYGYCNMQLKILENGDHDWECFGSCSAPGETCSPYEVTLPDGYILMCWCPQSSTQAQCPGSLWMNHDGLVVIRCLLEDMHCGAGHAWKCVTELSFNPDYFRDICKCDQ